MKSTREEVEKDLRSAIVPRSPERDEAEPTSPPHRRRDVFIKKFERLMSTVYEVGSLTFMSGGGGGLVFSC